MRGLEKKARGLNQEEEKTVKDAFAHLQATAGEKIVS